jgi:hypothetical protein
MAQSTFHFNAITMCILIEDQAEHDAQFDYLWSLYNYSTEACREQFAWCWLQTWIPKIL